MPPAVAHAPIVTRNFVARRTWCIRSASWAVVMEPSTSDISYGPLTTARVASGKYAISTASATARSSSSQSSRLSWQPSHEENFQTAILGLRFCVISDFPFCQQVADVRVREHRAILADEHRPELAVPAQADGTFHVTFHGQDDAVGLHAALFEGQSRKAHHRFRATDQRHRIERVKWRLGDKLRHKAHTAPP